MLSNQRIQAIKISRAHWADAYMQNRKEMMCEEEKVKMLGEPIENVMAIENSKMKRRQYVQNIGMQVTSRK